MKFPSDTHLAFIKSYLKSSCIYCNHFPGNRKFRETDPDQICKSGKVGRRRNEYSWNSGERSDIYEYRYI